MENGECLGFAIEKAWKMVNVWALTSPHFIKFHFIDFVFMHCNALYSIAVHVSLHFISYTILNLPPLP